MGPPKSSYIRIYKIHTNKHITDPINLTLYQKVQIHTHRYIHIYTLSHPDSDSTHTHNMYNNTIHILHYTIHMYIYKMIQIFVRKSCVECTSYSYFSSKGQ